jgi:hypothetical protein
MRPKIYGRPAESKTKGESQPKTISLNKILSFILAIFVPCLGLEARAEPRPQPQIERASKVKAAINQLGAGEETAVVVKLRNKTQLRGYVSQAYDDEFVVTDLDTGTNTSVPYDEVKQLDGENLSTGRKIATEGRVRRVLHSAARVAALGLPRQTRSGPPVNRLSSAGVSLIVVAALVATLAVILVTDK